MAVGGAGGLVNCGSVATASAVGGPGAAFWIWVAAFLGMMMKMAEVSLAVYYRSKNEKGGYYGGPTYYMEKWLGRDKGFKFWGVLAVIFGIGLFGSVFSMQTLSVAPSVNTTFGIPMLAVFLVITILLCSFVLSKTVYGRRVYACGGNLLAAQVSGINTTKIRISTFAIAGLLAGLSGFLMTSRVTIAQPTAAASYEMDAHTACVGGGGS